MDEERQGSEKATLFGGAVGGCLARVGHAVTRVKTVDLIQKEIDEQDRDLGEGDHGKPKNNQQLERRLNVFDLVFYGIGCTVGSGIYSLLSTGATIAGPAISLSYIVGGVACIFTGLTYSEFAARIPVAGSAYTYAYTSFGELVAWIIGWNLTLEYSIGSAAVARAWASYLMLCFEGHAPKWLNDIPLGSTICSPLAALICLLCTAVLMLGVKSSARFNNAITVLNLLVLLFVVVYGAVFVERSNWTEVNGSFVPYGAASIFAGAGNVFFSYVGFDMVSALAEEAKNPQRTVPLGIIGSLTISASVYVSVSLVVLGMVPFMVFDASDAPLAVAFQMHGVTWAARVVGYGALAALTTSVYTGLLGQPRIFYRMAKDGLLFNFFANVSPRARVPIAGTILTGVCTALIAFFTTLDVLADAISIGTLLAFCIVDGGVVILRYRSEQNGYRPLAYTCGFSLAAFISSICFALNVQYAASIVFGVVALIFLVLLCLLKATPQQISFKCPGVPVVPCIGIAVNTFMMAGLRVDSWIRLGAWLGIALLIYVAYGYRHSKLNAVAPMKLSQSTPLMN